MTMSLEQFLEHHGVKGQKWGVRRRSRVGKRPSEFNPKSKPKSKPAASSTSKLTDAQLRERVNRMQLEKQYKQLANETAPKTKGKKFVDRFMKESNDVLVNVIKSQAQGALNRKLEPLVKKKFG